ncbi:MAG: hypothetical protein HY920_05195 [Elusimicrobia bacterium]|nr:hypothetical protein [Elusimicrobiota bacterium]
MFKVETSYFRKISTILYFKIPTGILISTTYGSLHLLIFALMASIHSKGGFFASDY